MVGKNGTSAWCHALGSTSSQLSPDYPLTVGLPQPDRGEGVAENTAGGQWLPWRPRNGWRAYYAAQKEYERRHRLQSFLLVAVLVFALLVGNHISHGHGSTLYMAVGIAVLGGLWAVIRVTLTRPKV